MSTLESILNLLNKWPAWKRITQSPARIDELEKRIKSVEDKIKGSGELCPFCKQPTLELLEIIPDKMFGDLGVNVHKFKCSSCNKEYEKKIK